MTADDPELLQSVCDYLRRFGLEVMPAATAAQMRSCLRTMASTWWCRFRAPSTACSARSWSVRAAWTRDQLLEVAAVLARERQRPGGRGAMRHRERWQRRKRGQPAAGGVSASHAFTCTFTPDCHDPVMRAFCGSLLCASTLLAAASAGVEVVGEALRDRPWRVLDWLATKLAWGHWTEWTCRGVGLLVSARTCAGYVANHASLTRVSSPTRASPIRRSNWAGSTGLVR